MYDLKDLFKTTLLSQSAYSLMLCDCLYEMNFLCFIFIFEEVCVYVSCVLFFTTRGVNIASKSSSKSLKKECAALLENMKVKRM